MSWLKIVNVVKKKKDKKFSSLDFWRRRIPASANVVDTHSTTGNVEIHSKTGNGNVETVDEIVIDRIDDVKKSANDAHNYRYFRH